MVALDLSLDMRYKIVGCNLDLILIIDSFQITHGFDDQGSRYDDVGNLANWWDDATRGKFDDRAQCIINQYGGYTEPLTNLPLNGVNTQGENIADNGK